MHPILKLPRKKCVLLSSGLIKMFTIAAIIGAALGAWPWYVVVIAIIFELLFSAATSGDSCDGAP